MSFRIFPKSSMVSHALGIRRFLPVCPGGMDGRAKLAER